MNTLTVRSVFIVAARQEGQTHVDVSRIDGTQHRRDCSLLDSLQLTANYSVATPVNWTDGGDVIIVNSISDEDAVTKFPKGFKKVEGLPSRHSAAQQVILVRTRSGRLLAAASWRLR